MKLYIGNVNYSSWSLRAWILMRHYQLDFEQERIALFVEGSEERLFCASPSGRVPVLQNQDLVIWDSLAICEYINEAYLDGRALPQDRGVRAQVRARVAEIHSGIPNLRHELPMNCRSRRRVEYSAKTAAEIARIDQIWSQKLIAGEWLAGNFGILDAFSAPIASRFQTYGVELSTQASAYQQQLLASEAMQEWVAAAAAEPESIPCEDVGTPI